MSKKQYNGFKTNNICDIKTCNLPGKTDLSFITALLTYNSQTKIHPFKCTSQWFVVYLQSLELPPSLILEHFHHLTKKFRHALTIIRNFISAPSTPRNH